VKGKFKNGLSMIQVSYIDIVQTHDIEFGDIDQVTYGNRFSAQEKENSHFCMLTLILVLLVQIITETLPALHQLKMQGLVRFIGITGLPLPIFRRVLDRCFFCW
jgi:L-galactose dehydrogenase